MPVIARPSSMPSLSRLGWLMGLYAPRDFDVSPFFRIVKPRIESGFEFRSLTWADPKVDTQ